MSARKGGSLLAWNMSNHNKKKGSRSLQISDHCETTDKTTLFENTWKTAGSLACKNDGICKPYELYDLLMHQYTYSKFQIIKSDKRCFSSRVSKGKGNHTLVTSTEFSTTGFTLSR